jgi:hypothetical protein
MKTNEVQDNAPKVVQQKAEKQESAFKDERSETVVQTKLYDMVNRSPQVMQMQSLQSMADNRVNVSSFGVVQRVESRKDKIARIKKAQKGTDLGSSSTPLVASEEGDIYSEAAAKKQQKRDRIKEAQSGTDLGSTGTTLIGKEGGDVYSEKVAGKLQAHEKRVSEQTSEYDSNPVLKGKLHVAPHKFDIAGHGTQKITSEDYSKYAKTKGLSDKDSEHYMSGLTLMEDDYALRMEVERAEESVPGHNAHSGGYFSSKYSDVERQTFDSTTATGTIGTPDQIFHPGKHNPYQSDFNLKHRLTDAVPADSATGAYTNISSKFISDKISMEALNTAKTKATLELRTNPGAYQVSPGVFHKGFTVKCDLGKDVGSGFEADKANASLMSVEDLYGNNPAYDEAFSQLADVAKAKIVADKVKELFALGRSRIDVKNGIDALGYTYTNANNIVKAGETKVYDDSVISSIPSGAATGTQTGLTLKSIKADGSNAIWELGAGQHYPAQTISGQFGMTKFGSSIIVGNP